MKRQKDRYKIRSTSPSSNPHLDLAVRCTFENNNNDPLKDFLSYQLGNERLELSTDIEKRTKGLESCSNPLHICAQSDPSGCIIKLELPSWINRHLIFH